MILDWEDITSQHLTSQLVAILFLNFIMKIAIVDHLGKFPNVMFLYVMYKKSNNVLNILTVFNTS